MLFHPALAMFKDPLSFVPSLLYLKEHTHRHAGQACLMRRKLLDHINYLTFLRELGFYISSSLYLYFSLLSKLGLGLLLLLGIHRLGFPKVPRVPEILGPPLPRLLWGF